MVWNIGKYEYIGTWILHIYKKISVRQKLFKIHGNVWKKSKNDKISKNIYVKVIL